MITYFFVVSRQALKTLLRLSLLSKETREQSFGRSLPLLQTRLKLSECIYESKIQSVILPTFIPRRSRSALLKSAITKVYERERGAVDGNGDPSTKLRMVISTSFVINKEKLD
mmetsp:Transcript_42176/g.70362  ORF Transcript_42176/g.70362 Transcript_42176/m.70362 type:complete len:113 (-) Transcript_42176:42-380(-)